MLLFLNMNYLTLIMFFISSCIFKEGSSQSHAFIQVDNELKYLVDGIPVSMSEVLIGEQEQGFENIYEDRIISKNYLLFDPPFLDFKEHPTGMPLMKKVQVQNTSPDTSIHLHSLSGNTMHFHCTFFQDKVITPGGNTSFDVVFLGREEGFIENTIYVHTSVGTYRYWVKAVGSTNPYRIRPLIGVRMPLNSSYTPILTVHNPHNDNLQIMEMYSTGGDLHLELTDNVQDAESHHWSILPYHTKSLMRATFVARRENNHTAYIRIVPGVPINDYMVIPVEVEVSSEQGLFFPSDSLHFGLLTPHDPPVSVPLYLLNSAPKHIHIQNIITSTVNEAITIDFRPVKIPPGTVHPTQVATVTFDPSKVTSGVKVSGKLLVKSKISAYKLSIPFSIDLHQGSLIYNSSVTRFHSGADSGLNITVESVPSYSMLGNTLLGMSTLTGAHDIFPNTHTHVGPPPQLDNEPHDLVLKNTFKFPVVVHNITVPDEALPHFKVKWDGPIVIKQDGSTKVAELTLLTAGSDLRFTVNITIHTNITSINIPLIAYNGKLTKYIPPSGNESFLDFGTLGMGEQHNNYFYILNENPVEIRLKGWGSTLSHSAVELMGIVEGNLSDVNRNPNKTYTSKSLFLKPNHYAVFRIGILTPNSEGVFLAESFVQTQYEVIKLPFRLRTADGVLSIFPDKVLLEESFPGKISEQEIRILSTFGHSMKVEGINPQVPDPRFSYVTPDSCESQRMLHPDHLCGSQPILHPDHQSFVGKIVFNPNADCGNDCYTGFSLYSKVGTQWTSTFPLTSHAADVDVSLFSSHRHHYESLDASSFNVSLLLDTSEVRGHKFDAKVNLIWPRFVGIQELEFPLTQVYNTTYQEFTMVNSASQPVVAQIVFLHHYPSPQAIINVLQDQLQAEKNLSVDEGFDSLSEVFSFVDLDQGVNCNSCVGAGTHSSDGGTHTSIFNSDGVRPSELLSGFYARSRRSLEVEFKTRVAKDSLAIFLQPNSQNKIRLSFTPLDEKKYSAVILMRNNLTVLEALVVRGEGGRGRIHFKRTLFKTPSHFHFSVHEKNLKNCSFSSGSSLENPSMYTLRQTFLAENSGRLPVELYDFRIMDVPCQSYGFRVVNCSSFSLQPNESHRIEIAFTPDFSLFHVEQFLVIRTSLTGMQNSAATTATPPHSRKKENVTVDPNGNLFLRLVANISPLAVAKCGDKIPRPPWEPLLYYSVLILLVAMFVGTVIRAYLEAEHTLKTTFVAMTTVLPVDQPIPIFDKSKVFDLQAIGIQETESGLSDLGSETGSSADTKPYYKLKNQIQPAEPKKPNHNCNSGSNNNNNNNNFNSNNITANCHTNSHISYNKINHSKVNKVLNSNSAFSNDKLAKENQPPRRSGESSKNDFKNARISAMGISSFLSSLPFGMKKKQVQHNNCNSISSKHNKTRKNSAKEHGVGDNTCSSSSESKTQNEEEFSSTTTESSSVDDICVYIKDNYLSNFEEKSQKRKGSKSYASGNNDSVFPVRTSTINIKDTGFEITTKCKGIKKIKETSSKKHSSTLELPYTLKPTKVVDTENDRNKRTPKNKNKNPPSERNTSTSSQTKREETVQSPEPGVKRAPARAVIAPSARYVPQNQPLAPRDPSYSSIVLGNTKQKAKVTPVGKIIPEIKRVEKPLGAIGQKIPSSSTSGVFHSSLKPPLMGAIPTTSSAFSTPESLHGHTHNHTHSHGLYMGSLSHAPPHISTPQAVSSHSWDPKTLSSPTTIQSLGLDPLRNTTAMSDDDWLPFGAPNFPAVSVWGDSDVGVREKAAPNPPSPSLWESLNSFSIWSSPWSTDQSPLGSPSTLIGNGGSLWQPQGTYDMGSRLPPIGSFDSLRDINRQNKEKERDANM